MGNLLHQPIYVHTSHFYESHYLRSPFQSLVLPWPSLAQSPIGCYVPGSCRGTFTSIEQMDDEFACLDYCKTLPGCFYWTYYKSSLACRTHATCTELVRELPWKC